jgi:hypothetical protein
MSSYIPGVCNIGPDEIRSKYALAWISLAILVIFLIVAYFVPMPSAWKIVIFFPAFLSTLSFMQANNRFCVNLGLRGLMNMDQKAGKNEKKVEGMEFFVQDRATAKLLLIASLGISVVVTAIVVLI